MQHLRLQRILMGMSQVERSQGGWSIWCARQDLNLRPAGSKPDALSN